MKERTLADLKKDYSEIQRKYNLPSFEELNREFYIEKIAEAETDFLLREIRKFIADKFYNYMRLIETVLNPVNAPIFMFSLIKSITPEDKKKLGTIYDDMSEIYFEVIKLDAESSEKKDAEFTRKSYDSWLKIRKELSDSLEKIKAVKDKNEENSGSKYFG